MKPVALFASLVMVVAWPQPSSAFAPVLNPTQIAAAVHSGAMLFREGRGYQAPHHVLFAEQNTLHIRKGEGPIEAILVGTPYERLKYASYLAAFQGRPLGLQSAEHLARQNANVLQFVVFAHGSGPTDRDFLRRISSGTLRLGRYVLRPSGAPKVFGPAMDFYQIDGVGREFRWLGSVTFRFDLSAVRQNGAPGLFSFRDSAGTMRKYRVDLARYL